MLRPLPMHQRVSVYTDYRTMTLMIQLVSRMSWRGLRLPSKWTSRQPTRAKWCLRATLAPAALSLQQPCTRASPRSAWRRRTTALRRRLRCDDDCIASHGLHSAYSHHQLHYIVRCLNDPAYGTPTLDGYYAKLAAAFTTLASSAPDHPVPVIKVRIRCWPRASLMLVQIDCANGVGANSAKSFSAVVGKAIQLELFNDGSSGELNKNVRKCRPL